MTVIISILYYSFFKIVLTKFQPVRPPNPNVFQISTAVMPDNDLTNTGAMPTEGPDLTFSLKYVLVSYIKLMLIIVNFPVHSSHLIVSPPSLLRPLT